MVLRERERVSIHAVIFLSFICEIEIEKDCACVYVCMFVCVFVCAREREKIADFVFVWKTESVCTLERKKERESEREIVGEIDRYT